ncbi:MAG: hypothetical protein PHE03_07005 [Bacteroidales bacterium]|nr:hypothetical protein [Bacteroidales bacterium]MDD3892035.1 hypothetical protein [Bacteroidales bacterium]
MAIETDNRTGERTLVAVDDVLSDFSAADIKQKFEFMFQQTLQMADGMEGKDLAEMFEMLNRVAYVFSVRETEKMEGKPC